MYTTDDRNSIIYQAQVKLGELGYEIAQREEISKACWELYEQGYKISLALRVLLNPNIADQLEDAKIEDMLSCLIKLAEIKAYPAATPLFMATRPNIISGFNLSTP